MAAATSGAVVHAFDERSQPDPGRGGLRTERWAGLAAAVLRDEGVGRGELGLRFVDPGAMSELNSSHMGSAGPTDVLAFPIDGTGDSVHPPEQIPLLGDVVVCPAYAAEQAPEHAGGGHDGSLGDELALLVVHGVLHVLGYDHQSDADAETMQARERQLLTAHYRRQ
ncbi:MAG: rRNA maturation RNase YbeY [Acidimicrobiaceae bacterium]|nr:rRNA maturation RNase YbeY [Acidimicrobiaceae bacterium]MXY11458.1 rRNA maturation RNase YbeY [Acidimicrobiaceae bacterium]MXZ64171.1 rRNA maturation RNase YbeY [Acidimicrobiaceae bacterium]MYA13108.1 rRNA maturation RNase YbeY [Acidimicrobiaceae bacterium]MYF33498.1 rRNA maturation RNase YbeY [Acidimicrobiaceae bacterium]